MPTIHPSGPLHPSRVSVFGKTMEGPRILRVVHRSDAITDHWLCDPLGVDVKGLRKTLGLIGQLLLGCESQPPP